MKTAAIDFETYYDDKLSITVQGGHNYVFHQDFDAYMVTIKTDDGREFVGHPKDAPWAEISGSEWQWLHHNASFDELVLKRLRQDGVVPAEAFPAVTHCTADLVSYCGGPRSLKNSSYFFLKEEVSKDTRAAMSGKKWNDMTPEFKKEVSDYAMRDAELTLKLWQLLGDQWPEHERAVSRHTRQIGWDGIPVDVAEMDRCIPVLEAQNFDAGQQLPWYADGDEKPLSPKALAEQCRKVGIEPPPSLAKDSVECAEWEDKYGDTYPWVGAMRTFRRTNTLLEKLKSMRARVKEGTTDMSFDLLYFGAVTTGRWSGAGGVNVQNLPSKPMFGVDFRSLLKAPPGYKFINVDLSQIEPRCLAWLVGDEEMLEGLRKGYAIYEVHARNTMGWKGGKLKAENPSLYALAKARVLSLGYGAGAEKFVGMAANYGVKLSRSEAEDVVQAFRAASPLVCSREGLWNTLQKGMERSAREKTTYIVELPTGRKLRYFRPSMTGGLTAETNSGRNGVLRRKWWGGSLTENCLAGDTEVLVKSRGWVCLDTVRKGDLLWDGEEYVSHEGLVCRGEQKTLLVFGVKATPDHEFLTDKGWVAAEDACTLPIKEIFSLDEEVHTPLRTGSADRKKDREHGGNTSGPVDFTKNTVGSLLSLREEICEGWRRTDAALAERDGLGLREILPYSQEKHQSGEDDPRNVYPSSLLCLEVDERPLQSAIASSMEELRWERNIRVPLVEGVISGLLERCGSRVAAGVTTGPSGQLERVLPGELPMGYCEEELPKQKVEYPSEGVAGGLLGARRKSGPEPKHGVLPSKAPVELGEDVVCDTNPVFDILNCGPRHQFAVRAGEGFPILIAHNCVQATAREVFAPKLLEIESIGLPVLFHVHDELTCLVKEAYAEEALKEVLRILRTPPEFMPDLPLDAEGHIVDTYPNK